MGNLMFETGTPLSGQLARQVCVFFRPAQAGDRQVLKLQYGNGCSASVSQRKEYYWKKKSFI